MVVSKTSNHIQIKIPNPSQKPEAYSKTPNKDLKDMDVLCNFKIKIESQNLEYGCIKDQQPYPNQEQVANLKSRTPSILKGPYQGLKDLQNQDGEPKFRSWVYQRPATISKSRSKCQTPVRKLQQSPKPQMMI